MPKLMKMFIEVTNKQKGKNMKILNLAKTWNDSKVKAFLKKECGNTSLNYEERREKINLLAAHTDEMIKNSSFCREIHGYFFYTTEISAMEPDIWYRAHGFEGYKSAMGEPLETSEYTQRYSVTINQ